MDKNPGKPKKETRPKSSKTIQIDLPDWALLKLALMAHEQDITLNKLVSDIVGKYATEILKKHKSEVILG